jgi:hypothetical protein
MSMLHDATEALAVDTLDVDQSPPVEFITRMMGREVRCRWVDGEIEGDAELLERLAHLEAFEVDYSTPLATLTTLHTVLLDPITVVVLPS